ncbi:MAG: hypothetical protein NT061_04035 [Spirochaetes bacterium]|nr:hypothetical protein [Spirochaetota bacterium]
MKNCVTTAAAGRVFTGSYTGTSLAGGLVKLITSASAVSRVV